MQGKSNKLNAIELFSGAGGLSLGLHWDGWNVVSAFEYDTRSVETYRQNFRETDVLLTDVRDVDFTRYRGIDLVAGGPPCQPFSVAGKQLASDDSRDMVPEFVRAIREAKPTAFLMENVAGLLTKKHTYYTSWLVKQFHLLGYEVAVSLLDAASFGVPQHRKRVFFVGMADKFSFSFPSPTHGMDGLRPYNTVQKAIDSASLDQPNKAIVTYAKQPVLRPSPWAGMLVNGKGRPLNLNAPSHTIPATAGGNRTHIVDVDGILLDYHAYLKNGGSPRNGLVEGVRRLTVRESARIQSFPNTFSFTGPRSSQYRQVGNAVPPLLAQAVSNRIRASIQRTDSISFDNKFDYTEELGIQLPLFAGLYAE